MVRMMGLEPIRSYEHEHLKLACLPAYSSTRAYFYGIDRVPRLPLLILTSHHKCLAIYDKKSSLQLRAIAPPVYMGLRQCHRNHLVFPAGVEPATSWF